MDLRETCYISYDLQLFAKDGPNGEKTEEPTAKKLADARNRGQTMRSQDVTTAATLLMFFVLLKMLIPMIGGRFLNNFPVTIGRLAEFSTQEFDVNRACAIVREALKQVVLTCLPFLVVGYVVTTVSILVQVKWKVTTEPMKPKFDKFNPVQGVKRLFSVDKLMELLKSLAKLAVLLYVVYSYLKNQWTTVFNMYHYTLGQALEIIGNVVVDIGLRISLCFAAIAVIDFFYQKWKFHQDMMMTKQEVKDEYKNAEGDPKVKSQQKARMQQAARRRMMQELPKADVVITNPTHLAVALRYDRDTDQAPVVVAKGADYLAQKIKDVARENQIEIVENKPLARMLYQNVDLGAQIPPELYQMVAEILAYVYGLQGRLNES